jgi:hypothetical protein
MRAAEREIENDQLELPFFRLYITLPSNDVCVCRFLLSFIIATSMFIYVTDRQQHTKSEPEEAALISWFCALSSIPIYFQHMIDLS